MNDFIITCASCNNKHKLTLTKVDNGKYIATCEDSRCPVLKKINGAAVEVDKDFLLKGCLQCSKKSMIVFNVTANKNYIANCLAVSCPFSSAIKNTELTIEERRRFL